MAETLFNLFIFPLSRVIEFVFVFTFKLFRGSGAAVIGVSAVISICCLPLYLAAEKKQEAERALEARMKPKVDKIKAVFKGDERYMILAAYYRQMRYHPLYALRASLGVLIQIPFFIAAYDFLSHLDELRGASFLFVGDLGAPDTLLSFGGVTLHALPIAMTLINILSGAVYTRGFPLKEKAQLYGVALVFLLLLYTSPSGLVLYWTCNNLFSLGKNIVLKMKRPRLVCVFLAASAGVCSIFYILILHTGSFPKRLLAAGAFALLMALPAVYAKQKALLWKALKPLAGSAGLMRRVFFLSAASLAVLCGVTVPSFVIASSPQEFSFLDGHASPFYFIWNAGCAAAGAFLVWPGLVFFLFKKNVKVMLAALFFALLTAALVNVFVFSGDYGNISNTFRFDSPGVLTAPLRVILLNGAALLLALAAVYLLLRAGKLQTCAGIAAASLCALIAVSVPKAAAIARGYEQLAAIKSAEGGAVHAVTPIFSLSATKPNVIVVMSDRAINGFVRPILAESPELQAQFDGWTLFPNTVSFDDHTLIAASPLWGGYEYTPDAMNRRGDEPLASKHNEALLVLPRLLTSAGFHVTVTDPSWANYSWIPDITIYKPYPGVDAVNTIGRYSAVWYQNSVLGAETPVSGEIKRRALWFALLKAAPPALRRIVYDDGDYWGPEEDNFNTVVDSYSVLDYLPELTSYTSEVSQALLITNELTHTSRILQPPDYVPAKDPVNLRAGLYAASGIYHTNAAFFHRFGEWLDALKAHGVYDNTRIIIVSDHGSGVDTGIPRPEALGKRVENYNPVLMLKDFNAHGPLAVDTAFMTNADTPLLALSGIAENPVNPFTGTPLTDEAKRGGVVITTNELHLPHYHNRTTFKIKANEWFRVKDNIFKPGNWSRAEPEE